MLYRNFLKRLMDFMVSLCLLLVFAPVFLLISCILIFQTKANPFFSQIRPGKNEREIRILKFKSMTDAVDIQGKLLPDNERITNFGRFLRTSSLDELPQLINVLKGEMSLIGPRPLLFKYIPLFSAEQKQRHLVRPGITGWAQVNGRNSISWTKKFELDVHYVKNVSFLFDLKIVWLTILKVIKKEGINQGVNRPMEPFNGKN